jgi:hypothetical protein
MADKQPTHGPSAKSKIPRHFQRSHNNCGRGDGDCTYSQKKLKYEPDSSQPPSNWGNNQFYNNHHVLPVSSLAKFETWKAYDKDEGGMICAVYAVTKWCVNHESNLIRLPKDIKVRERKNVLLPAHNRDHNNIGGYNDQVTTQLHLEVWAKAKKATKKELHPKDGKTELLAALQSLKGRFKKRLKYRGSKEGMAGNSMVTEVLSRDKLIKALKLKKGQSSWR